MKEINGVLSAQGMKIALVVSRFNSFLTEQLVKGAEDAFVRHGGDASELTLVKVPGAYEIPLAAMKLAEASTVGGRGATRPTMEDQKAKYDAVVALGCVVQGATPHATLIETCTAEAFTKISLKTGVPILDGIVAAENLEQAVERCGTKQGNKGFSAMMAAIEMAQVVKQL